MRILYFASLREHLGRGEEEIALPAEIGTVGGLIDHLVQRDPARATAFADRARLRAAVNQTIADRATRVSPGDEIAFFPPMTGG